VANNLENLGFLLSLEGDLPGGRTKYEQALAIASEIGGKHLECTLLWALADLLYLQGNLPGAEKMLERVESIGVCCWRKGLLQALEPRRP
jgi:hypothetical protein